MKKKVGLLLAAVALIAIGLCLWLVLPNWLDGQAAERTEAETAKLYAFAAGNPTAAATAVTVTPTVTVAPQLTLSPSPTVSPEPTPEPVPTPPPLQADFEDLYQQNSDIVGWLTAGERIDYPVVWRDNDHYLHYDFFQRANNNGTVFLNGNNRLWPADDVWLIHGHNMASGAMFGTLARFRSYSYLCQHPLVMFRTIYDPQPVYYVPVAAFDASMLQADSGYFDITQIAFPNDDEMVAMAKAAGKSAEPTPVKNPATMRQSAAFQKYLEQLQRKSVWDSPADVTVDDSLLMLVTCSYIHQDGRFMLVCRKLRENETCESVTALFE